MNEVKPAATMHCMPAVHLGVQHLKFGWPPALQAVALAGVNGQEERKRRLRAELMRWHPDKFAARFGRLLAEASATQISERVNETSQILNSLNALVAS